MKKKLIEEILEHKDKIKSCDKRVNEVYELAHDHIIDIINIQPKADWIPCEERLPHTEMPVWTTHENGQVIEHYWYRGKFVNNYPLEPRPYPKVIAWMPKEIPQPYKKEGADNG